MTVLKSPSAAKTSAIEARCAATGMRMTEQRRVIARVLAEAADHPDVEELYRRCVAVDDKISISTVYRTVKLFEDAGIIERHDFREGRARYEQMRDSHHDHLINLRDGKVIEFTSEEIEKLQAEIARKLGYKLVDHRLELYCVPLDDDTEELTWPIDLVIFDCDGVLVDSEVISCRAHAQTLTRHGYPITAEQVLERFLGRSDAPGACSKSKPRWAAPAGRLPLAGVCRTTLPAVCDFSCKPSPHIAETLARIAAAGLRRVERDAGEDAAPASTAPACTDASRRTFFPRCKSRHGKPAPDLFLFAAEQMGAAPDAMPRRSRTASPASTGARAAGMTVLGFHGGSHCRPGHAATAARGRRGRRPSTICGNCRASSSQNHAFIAGFSAT